MTRKIPKKQREKSTYINYFIKGEEFCRNMEDCLLKKEYDTAALCGIHGVISLLDALLVFSFGYVSASFNHEDAVILMSDLVNLPEVKQQSKHVLEVLRYKSKVEYLDCLATEKQALSIQKNASRFYDWVKKQLPKRA